MTVHEAARAAALGLPAGARPRANSYPGPCRLCGSQVEAGAGLLRGMGRTDTGKAKWAVEHKPDECLTEPTIDPLRVLRDATALHTEVQVQTINHGESLDAGGGMVALRCRDCGNIDEVHDCDGTVRQHQEWSLYVWRDVFTDYTGGVAVALARTPEEARKIVQEKCGGLTSWVDEIARKVPDRYPVDQTFALTVAGGS